MEYNYSEIGERIRCERKKLGYNQEEFISKLEINIGRNTLSKIENGNLPPQKFTMPLLIAMCKLFKCDIGYLLGEYDASTRNDKIIQEEIGLSGKSISNIKINMFNSITKKPVYNPFVSELNDLLSDTSSKTPTQETYIYSLNLILEEYPELIAYIGKIMLHNELGIYTDFLQRGNVKIQKSYDIDKPLLNLIIKLKYYIENKKKLKHITNMERYQYAIQFITKHMQALEKENADLYSVLNSIHDFNDEHIDIE